MDTQDDDTPTNSRHSGSTYSNHYPLSLAPERQDPLHYSPIDPRNNPFANSPIDPMTRSSLEFHSGYDGAYTNTAASQLNERNRGNTPQPPIPSYAKKPYLHLGEAPEAHINAGTESPIEDNPWTLPSQGQLRVSNPHSSDTLPGQGYGTPLEVPEKPSPLRIANRNSTIEGRKEDKPRSQDDEWAREALGYMGYVSGHYGP